MNAREWEQVQTIAARGGRVAERYGRAECICGNCGTWHSLPGLGREVRDDVAAVRLAMEAGWANVREQGWHCPKCVEQKEGEA